MGDVIPFPDKKNFVDKHASHLPKEVRECLSTAYDEVIKKVRKFESLSLTIHGVSNDQVEKANKFSEEIRSLFLGLVAELLETKAELCIFECNKSQTY